MKTKFYLGEAGDHFFHPSSLRVFNKPTKTGLLNGDGQYQGDATLKLAHDHYIPVTWHLKIPVYHVFVVENLGLK